MTHIGGIRRRLATTVSCAGLVLAMGFTSGCYGPEPGDDEDLGRMVKPLQGTNGMGYNGLGTNGMGYNGLSTNGMGYNGMGYNGMGYNGMGYNGMGYNGLNYPGLIGNEIWKDWMTDPAYTDQPVVFDYIVKCALGQDQTIAAIEIDGQTHGPWTGNMGLAPAWYDIDNDVQTEAEQERVSACLMAHVNAVTWHVLISVLSDAMAPPTAAETAQFWAFEGQFYGNVFNDNPSKASCWAGDEVNGATPEQLQNIERLCAITPSLCYFDGPALCSEQCSGWDSTLEIYTECEGFEAVAVYVDP